MAKCGQQDTGHSLFPTLTGHEGPTFIISTALNVAGPPLGDFIECVMSTLEISHT